MLGTDPDNPTTALDYYHNTGGQIIEVRKGGAEYPLEQYLWSPRYVHAPIVRWRDGNTDNDLEEEGDSTLYYCTDANFNVTALVNTSGTVVERYLYDPYGKVTVCDGSWTPREGNASAYSNEVLFTGHRLDAESGHGYFACQECGDGDNLRTWRQRMERANALMGSYLKVRQKWQEALNRMNWLADSAFSRAQRGWAS